ncbi:hypothetical protein E2562_011739 [Oryza meyeriana var. granulata]|uniref:DUF223 domain-containing protein n=1 Tax=Oryza meyeriana var. granulata TaxID=110450 RepID=A0A6G1DJ44_9ORYZ|nr:hypothetical protein E2562_011739 [Oryza meyeriana var. granulata]
MEEASEVGAPGVMLTDSEKLRDRIVKQDFKLFAILVVFVRRMNSPAQEIGDFPITHIRSLELHEVHKEHIFRTCWKVRAEVMFKSPMQQNMFGIRYIQFILKDTTETFMEALAYDMQADRFNGTICSGLVYEFSNVGFHLMDVPTHVNLTIQAEFCMVLTPTTTFRMPRFIDFSDIFTEATGDGMVIDVVGLLIYVGEVQYPQPYARNIPNRDIALVNRRMQVVFVRIWGEHASRNTVWRQSMVAHFCCVSATCVKKFDSLTGK